jgi:hypothetical protein
MKMWNRCWMGLALAAALATRLHAQIPTAAPAAAPPAAVGTAAAAGAGGPAAPAAGPNLFSFLCPTPAQMAACKLCFCNSALGKMVTSMMGPVSVFSGGLLSSRCPAVNAAADLAKPADSAEGAAARIQMDELDAKARRAAVRYLGTVDCRYWPEAQDGLINSLRADRNECVRLEAAWALGRGCCCTRKTLEALALTVSGSERDGNPIERSDRVKAAAAASLDHCLACLADTAVDIPLAPPPEEVPLPKEGPPSTLPDVPGGYYKRVEKQPMQKVVENARRTLAQARPATQVAAEPRPERGGVIDIVTHAFHPTANPAASKAVAPAAAQTTPAVPAAPVVQAASASHTTPPLVVASRPAPPANAAQGPAPLEVQHLLARLRHGTPADRQVAAEELTASPWSARRDVTEALTACGRNDPEPAVRATCLRCLSRISFNQMPQ